MRAPLLVLDFYLKATILLAIISRLPMILLLIIIELNVVSAQVPLAWMFISISWIFYFALSSFEGTLFRL